MASEKQIAANRRNAAKSTGPRSSAGRKRVSRNAYRHGLSVPTAPTLEEARQIEALACQIAGDVRDRITLEYARSAAHAEFELARIKRAKVTAIDRMEMPAEGPDTTSADPTRLSTQDVIDELSKLDRYEKRSRKRLSDALTHVVERTWKVAQS